MNIFKLIVLNTALLITNCTKSQSNTTKENSTSINLEKFDYKYINQILNNEATLIIDVRTIEEFKKGHINNSINIPLNTITDSISSLKKHENIILVCRSGNRSEKAKKILQQAGFQNVYNGGKWQTLEKLINTK